MWRLAVVLWAGCGRGSFDPVGDSTTSNVISPTSLVIEFGAGVYASGSPQATTATFDDLTICVPR